MSNGGKVVPISLYRNNNSAGAVRRTLFEDILDSVLWPDGAALNAIFAWRERSRGYCVSFVVGVVLGCASLAVPAARLIATLLPQLALTVPSAWFTRSIVIYLMGCVAYQPFVNEFQGRPSRF